MIIGFFTLFFEDALFGAGFGAGDEVVEMRFLGLAVEMAFVTEVLALDVGVFVGLF